MSDTTEQLQQKLTRLKQDYEVLKDNNRQAAYGLYIMNEIDRIEGLIKEIDNGAK